MTCGSSFAISKPAITFFVEVCRTVAVSWPQPSHPYRLDRTIYELPLGILFTLLVKPHGTQGCRSQR